MIVVSLLLLRFQKAAAAKMKGRENKRRRKRSPTLASDAVGGYMGKRREGRPFDFH